MPDAKSNHAGRILSSLNQQRASGRFCDAVLHLSNGEEYVAHRSVLACFSELFDSSDACAEVCLKGCPGAGLELLLDFIYSGKLPLDRVNLQPVQQAASALRVPEVVGLCRHFEETSAQPGKRRRGRPRKSEADSAVVKEDVLLLTEVEDFGSAGPSATTTTTTRSGRVVKGPRRLETEAGADSDAVLNAESVNVASFPYTQGAELQLFIQTNGEVAEEAPEDDQESEDLEISMEDAEEDADEDYAPEEPPDSSQVQSREQEEVEKEEEGEEVKDDSAWCNTCNKSFKSKYYLKVHNRRHTGEKPFACHKCGKRYLRKENLTLHETRGCTDTKIHSCPTCLAVFPCREELRAHFTSHSKEMPYTCSICQEQFMYKKTQNSHMMRVHGLPKPHACSECPKTFLSRTELKVHVASKHRGEKPYVCEECGHRASSRNGLQMHIKAIHRNERPYVCQQCGHAFSQKNNLNMHLRVHSGERPFQCHLCGKTFRTQGSLDKHQRTHTGERPFPCDMCEQRFTEKGALLRHKASKHEEGRPHCCQICSKTFKAKEQLRVHLRRHKGVRNFECKDCGYKFTRQAHLRRHSQIHKRTENYNPRQRKLRNLVVHETSGEAPPATDQSSDTDAPKDSEETDYNQKSEQDQSVEDFNVPDVEVYDINYIVRNLSEGSRDEPVVDG